MGRPPRVTRSQILETARGVFTTRGFKEATLAEIGTALGVTAAAILRHVGSKETLFADAMTAGDPVDPPASILELATINANADPRVVLRRVAEEVVPFIAGILSSRIVVAMRENAMQTSVELPFDPSSQDTPPRRAFLLLAGYFARANEAGTMSVRDPRASALLFMGSLQGYVLFHHVLKVRPIYPLHVYIDALIDLWSSGAIREPSHGGSRGSKQSKKTDSTGALRAGRVGGSGVHARTAKAEAARPRRNPRGENGERRVSRGRPRRPRRDR